MITFYLLTRRAVKGENIHFLRVLRWWGNYEIKHEVTECAAYITTRIPTLNKKNLIKLSCELLIGSQGNKEKLFFHEYTH